MMQSCARRDTEMKCEERHQRSAERAIVSGENFVYDRHFLKQVPTSITAPYHLLGRHKPRRARYCCEA